MIDEECYVVLYIMLGIYMKESKRTHRFSVTPSFAPKRSFDRKVPYIYIYIYIYIIVLCLVMDLYREI